MLTEIITHTPPYVWGLLGFFVYRGLAARRDRDVPVWSLFILPVVLLALGIQGIAGHYGLAPMPLLTWLGAAATGSALGYRSLRADAVAQGVRGILMRGSWLPLVLVLAVFFTKYCAEVLIAMRPDLMLQPEAVVAVCALYGLLSGFFLGRLGRTLALYRALSEPARSSPFSAGQTG
jgi:hypothetical protein